MDSASDIKNRKQTKTKSGTNAKQSTPRHITVRLLRTKSKKGNLKTTRDKRTMEGPTQTST